MNTIIAGAGNIGLHLAKRFNMLGRSSITIIENNPEKARIAGESLDAIVLIGSSTNQNILINAGIDNADLFVALTNNDEINLISCKIAKKLGAKTTIARVKNTQYIQSDFILNNQELGVDLIIQPEKETAEAIIKLIKMSSTTDTIEFENGLVQFTGIRLEDNIPLLNTPFATLNSMYDIPPLRVVAIKRGQFTIIPDGNSTLRKGDQIFFITDNTYLNSALEIFGKKNVRIKDILIIGGGQIGSFIAKNLENSINIKIIEIDEHKAMSLAEYLDNTLIIHGDGSDLDLTVNQGLKDMDEVITVTGDDETNIITSIVARHIKVPRTVTLISKNEYLPLAPALGLDAIVSKQQITVNSIESFLKTRLIANVAGIPGLDADVIEYIARKDSKITKYPLKKINFPKQSIIGAVLKDNSLIIPTGETKIDAGDKVIVLTMLKSIKSVEKLFH